MNDTNSLACSDAKINSGLITVPLWIRLIMFLLCPAIGMLIVFVVTIMMIVCWVLLPFGMKRNSSFTRLDIFGINLNAR